MAIKPAYLKQIRARQLPELSPDDVALYHKKRDYDRLFCEYAHIVPYIIQRYIGDYMALEQDELLSQGNVAALKAIKSWRPQKGSAMLSWIYLHCRFAIIKEAENQRARKKDAENCLDSSILEDIARDSLQDGAHNPELATNIAIDIVQDSFESIEQSQAIEAALAQLPIERDRHIMVMYLAGMTQQEIARGLVYQGYEAIGQPQISRIVRKGLETIRHTLADYSA